MNDFIELRGIIATVMKWWWLIGLSTVVAAAIGYGASQRQTPVYRATTTIIVGQGIQATEANRQDLQTSELLAFTYANIARRQPVLQGTVDSLDLKTTWQALKKRVRAEPVAGTQLLEIAVEAKSPEEARMIADEIAQHLILLSPTGQQNETRNENQRYIRERLEDLRAKIEVGKERVKALEDRMVGPLSAQQLGEIQAEIDTLERLIASWEDSYTQLLITTESDKSPNYLAIIEPAQASSSPVRPKVRLNTLLASVLGLVQALGLVFLLEYLDDTLKSADDLSQSLGITALGAVSRMKGRHYQEQLISAVDPFSSASEAYRMVRSNIQFKSVSEPIKSVVVTSSNPGEGKSVTAANLGMIMAQAGLKTIIVDADLRRPTQHEIFQMPHQKVGLTGLLRWPELEIKGYLNNTRVYLKNTQVENLQLLDSGIIPPNPAELLGSPRMGQLMASLSEEADVIIYDSPPVLAVTDAVILSNRVDGVVLVIEAGKTRQDAAKQAIGSLQAAGANVLGAVLNQVSSRNGGYQTGGYYYTRRGHMPAGLPADSRPKRLWQWLPFFR
jgi:polysaccharide biosynthesis transport protein